MPIDPFKCCPQGIISFRLHVDKLPKPPRKNPQRFPHNKREFFFFVLFFFCMLSANHPIQSAMSADAGWAHPAPVVHYLVQNLKKGNQARPDSPVACHPPKDDVTEWKQGHDLNMSERVKEEFTSIYRSNSGARLLFPHVDKRKDGIWEVF